MGAVLPLQRQYCVLWSCPTVNGYRMFILYRMSHIRILVTHPEASAHYAEWVVRTQNSIPWNFWPLTQQENPGQVTPESNSAK
jgi:hypothetical protein